MSLVSEAARDGATLSIQHLNAGSLSPASDHDPLPRDACAGPARSLTTNWRPPLPSAASNGEPLRTWLRENWYDDRHASLGYGEARRAMYARIDAREDGRVYGVYSGFSQPAADVTFLDPINAEHTVPQSWFGSAEPMRSDLHHLFPTHKGVNAARGTKPFGEIIDTETDRWFACPRRASCRSSRAFPTRRPSSMPRTLATSSSRRRPRRATQCAPSSTSTRCTQAEAGPSRNRGGWLAGAARLARSRPPGRPRAPAERPHRGGATQPKPVRRSPGDCLPGMGPSVLTRRPGRARCRVGARLDTWHREGRDEG